MKIALVCTSLGYAFRGLERFTFDLFNLLKEELPLTLFGSQLNGKFNEVSLPCLKFDGLLSVFKGRTKDNRDNYYFQQLSYALSFIPLVVWQGYDIVHYSEPPMGSFLYHAKRRFKFRYKILFTNWGMERFYLDRFDHVQEITPHEYQQTITSGINPRKVTFLPYGVDAKKFTISTDQNILREKYGVPKDKTVILSVAALNRRHKRMDYLIQEVSRLGEKYFLLMVGYPEEPDLIELGKRLLGENFQSLYFSFDPMPEIYRLADLFVIPSLIEGFCLALVEAMCAGLPVIAHDSPHFQWMIEDSRCLVDLQKEGNLARKIEEVVGNYEAFERIAERNRTRTIERFDWNRLKKQYLSLYEQVFLSPL